ncbi:unnamed protein product [Triticum turgidum subsp. durum]|uniref:DNA polymerase delta subunit 3 n=1 Tax=Triticum turgidum subsp. durum TaxID=4567 RepID=A0A9R0RE62_TRITD|nr:unnamed protein product [Triticum turgidum subsp. durum]
MWHSTQDKGDTLSRIHQFLRQISYKWLSRNFSVSSDDAKRLLQEFVNKHGTDHEVIYSVSGWLKNNPQNYCVKLTSGPKLEEARRAFKDSCSVQVYSIQACIPKDTAVLWNPEFVQAEELFNQPFDEENCLRDNRHPYKGFQDLPGPSDPVKGTSIKAEKDNASVLDKTVNAPAVKEPSVAVHANKTKAQNGKTLPSNGASLATMWGRASAKPKAPAVTKATDLPSVAADAQICAKEEADADSSDDEKGAHYKRASNGASNRKRRAIFDCSDDDDDDDFVAIASPEPPKQCARNPVTEAAQDNISEQKKVESKQDTTSDVKGFTKRIDSDLTSECKTRSDSATNGSGITLKEKAKDSPNKKDQAAETTSTSPKRRKVLKTRIDERGREVTEVVWEGEAPASDKAEKNVTNTDATNRPTLPSKPQPAANTDRNNAPSKTAGGKKPAKAAPKQGKNIMSFFKKLNWLHLNITSDKDLFTKQLYVVAFLSRKL